MTSQAKPSKRKRVRKWFEDLLQPGGGSVAASRPASQISGSSVSPSASAQPSRPPTPAVNNQIAQVSAPAPSNTGQSTVNLPTQGAAPTPAVAATTNPGPTTADKLKQAGNAAWSVLEATLRVLEKSADAFPPLKSAVGGFIACLDMVQTAAANREEYENLANEVDIVANNLKEYVSQLGAEANPSIARLVSSIKTQVEHIDEKRNLGGIDQLVKSTENKEDVIKCYRKVGSLLLQLQYVITLRTWKNTDMLITETLLQKTYPVDEARYNSSYAGTIRRRECTKYTREKVQKDLQDWVEDPDGAKLYWMNGMAGTGKTTIAYSLCKWLEGKDYLGASFFCSRALSSCDDFNRIVPTIAYRLARYSPTFRSSLCKVLEGDPDASKLDVVNQFQKLIERPIREVKEALPENVVVVIDALDECKHAHGAGQILQILLRFAEYSPLKFFVTSRPDPTIVKTMQSGDGCLPSVIYLHDIEQSLVEDDIRKYLTEALSTLSPPPSDYEISQLTKRAGVLFIYAATVARYICPEDPSIDTNDRLQDILQVDPRMSSNEPNEMYDELDMLYTTILRSALSKNLKSKEIENRQLVLRTVICAQEPLTSAALATLLGLTERQVSLVVQSLQSVLHLSEDTSLVSTLHASFPDYMFDQLRSSDLYCNTRKHHKLLAGRCFAVMQQLLQFNICKLKSSAVFDRDIPNLAQQIQTHISPALFYTCINWSVHLQLAPFTEDLQAQFIGFLSHRLLFWMEVLNLRQRGEAGIEALQKAQDWLKGGACIVDAQEELADCQDFVTRYFANVCCHSTPHIYISALPFQRTTSAIHARYRKRMCRLKNVAGTIVDQKQDTVAIWNTKSSIRTLALSHDGTRIATSSQAYFTKGGRGTNCAISVWDARTGSLIAGPFDGHSGFVNSVAFSPEGKRIVSGSGNVFRYGDKVIDCTIRVWDAHSGNLVAGPFEGHTGSVNSVAFSPDGKRVISGSGSICGPINDEIDCTIRVWDAHTGNLVAGPFEGHTSPINSVAFSPDGERVVSGSGNLVGYSWEAIGCTIRVWDAHTGNLIAGSFEGHTGSVNSVAFSPDGERVVSGSGSLARPHNEAIDCTIRVWDAHTGNLVAGPFEGHTSPVNSVAFSPGGERVVSGSGGYSELYSRYLDCTIRVWDAHTGNLVAGPFEGHTGFIKLVAFSRNGTSIISGSVDGILRIWDLKTNTAISETSNADVSARNIQWHTGPVNSVAFSPDGERIVSGSGSVNMSSEQGVDCTIRVWDAHTGNLIAGPFEGHTGSVNSVAFSPGGERVVSGSGGYSELYSRYLDCTIRVWDAHSGKLVAGPFEGHTGAIKSVAFSPDGKRIASGSGSFFKLFREAIDYTIRVWDADTGHLVVGPFGWRKGSVNSVAFSPDGKRIVSGSSGFCDTTWLDINCIVQVWDAHTGHLIGGPFHGHESSVNSVAFSPDGKLIVSGSGSFSELYLKDTDCTIRVWDAHTGNLIAGPFEGHTGYVNSVAFSPDGKHIVSGSGSDEGLPGRAIDCTIRVWDAYTGNLVAGPFEGHRCPVKSVAFSPSGTHVLSASGGSSDLTDSQIRLFDIRQQGSSDDIWSINEVGWVTANGLLLFWIPLHLRAYIRQREDALVIDQHGSLCIDYENFVWGDRWTECYAPSEVSLG